MVELQFHSGLRVHGIVRVLDVGGVYGKCTHKRRIDRHYVLRIADTATEMHFHMIFICLT
jgi:hypothetical protein